MSDASVRHAEERDLRALKILDPWPKDTAWRHKITGREVIVLEVDGVVVGVARFDVLWTTVPFLSLITIDPAHRGSGHSRKMLAFLAAALRDEGYVALLSSSQTDEPAAQAWHRHLGFRSNGIIENVADDDVGEIVYRMLL